MLTSSQMRDVEQAAMDAGTVTGAELMERAGAGVVRAMLDRWPGWDGLAARPCDGQMVLVLCGPGNNGGDGYVIARLLAEAGADVRVLALGDPARLPRDAARAHGLWSGPVAGFGAAEMQAVVADARRAGQDRLVIVDALFGIGQRAPLDEVTEVVWTVLEEMASGGGILPWVAAVDLPTGYDADTGVALAQRPLPSDLTVTFHQPKPIHGMPHFLDGELVVHDIGL